MKESERLREEARREENDLKALGLYNKALREERSEKSEKYVEQLRLTDGIEVEDGPPGTGRITIKTKSFGIVDYYPKANKILLRAGSKWKRPGLAWIIKNLLTSNQNQ